MKAVLYPEADSDLWHIRVGKQRFLVATVEVCVDGTWEAWVLWNDEHNVSVPCETRDEAYAVVTAILAIRGFTVPPSETT